MRAKSSSLIAALAIGASLFAPISANAAEYHSGYQCAAHHRGLWGGVTGALIGGVIGHNVAAYAVQAEGAGLGALVFGIAGYALGHHADHCEPAR